MSRTRKPSVWEGCECLIEGCTQPVNSRWLCVTHYTYYYKNFWQGTRRATKRTVSGLERFQEKIRFTMFCWHWGAALSKKGYGTFESVDYPNETSAHRVAYIIYKGAIPEGMEIDHWCKVRDCVNPLHLRTATRSQNIQNRYSTATNSKSGLRGVQDNGDGSYGAYVTKDGTRHWLGTYQSKKEALAVVVKVRAELFTHHEEDLGVIKNV